MSERDATRKIGHGGAVTKRPGNSAQAFVTPHVSSPLPSTFSIGHCVLPTSCHPRRNQGHPRSTAARGLVRSSFKAGTSHPTADPTGTFYPHPFHARMQRYASKSHPLSSHRPLTGAVRPQLPRPHTHGKPSSKVAQEYSNVQLAIAFDPSVSSCAILYPLWHPVHSWDSSRESPCNRYTRSARPEAPGAFPRGGPDILSHSAIDRASVNRLSSTPIDRGSIAA